MTNEYSRYIKTVKTSYCVFLPGFRNGALMPTISLLVKFAKFTKISLIPIISATHSSYPLSCRPFCNLKIYNLIYQLYLANMYIIHR